MPSILEQIEARNAPLYAKAREALSSSRPAIVDTQRKPIVPGHVVGLDNDGMAILVVVL